MRIFEGFEKETKDGGFEKWCKSLLELLGYECELTSDSNDGGIDIIATNDSDESFGIQCKNWDNTVGSPIVRGLSGSIAAKGLDKGMILTTSNFSSEAKEVADTLGITLWNWSKLSTLASDLDIIPENTDELLTESVVFDHNLPVYNQLEEYLEKDNKALVVIGTGIGKSTTALEYCYRHNCRALVVCPMIAIKEDWEKNSCIDTITYQSFAKQYKDIDYSKYGVIICDEVHHAGASTWGAGVNYLIENNIKVIGLTATAYRLDGIDIISDIFGGNLCKGLDVIDGINEGILHPFSYVGAYYNTDEVCDAIKEKYGDKLDEYLVGQLDIAKNNTPELKDIVTKHMPIGKRKGIIFVETVADIDEGIKLIKDIYPDLEYRSIYSGMNNKEIEANRERFKNTDEGYLCSIDMVKEGIHYDNVNTLFMFRRTKSPVLFEQQLGRIITLAKKENPNAIVFDLVNNSNTIKEFKLRIKSNIDKFGGSVSEIGGEGYEPGAVTPKFDDSYGMSQQIIYKDFTTEIDNVLGVIKDKFDDKPWTEKEDNELRKWYPIEKQKCFSRLPNRTINACKLRVVKLGLQTTKYHPWTIEEDNFLRKYYPIEHYRCFERLPDRSIGACYYRVKVLHMHISTTTSWTTNEDNTLVNWYPIEKQKCFSRLPNRTKHACMCRVKILGITEKNDKQPWTTYEDTTLIEWYPIEGKKCFDRLPNRTYASCITRISKLNLTGGHKTKKIMCIELAKTFNSVHAAATSISRQSSNIRAAIKCNGTCGGYHWKYIED